MSRVFHEYYGNVMKLSQLIHHHVTRSRFAVSGRIGVCLLLSAFFLFPSSLLLLFRRLNCEIAFWRRPSLIVSLSGGDSDLWRLAFDFLLVLKKQRRINSPRCPPLLPSQRRNHTGTRRNLVPSLKAGKHTEFSLGPFAHPWLCSRLQLLYYRPLPHQR